VETLHDQTKESKMLGLAPYDALESDFVCILYGCSVPIILRRFQEISTSEGNPGQYYYRIVGEYHIHSMMAGGAFRIRDEKLARLKRENPTIETLTVTFELR
jgi:hypothetical protein